MKYKLWLAVHERHQANKTVLSDLNTLIEYHGGKKKLQVHYRHLQDTVGINISDLVEPC